MRRFQASLSHLLLLVLGCGVALAALRSASELWSALLFTLAVGSFLVAVLLTVYRRGGRRAFWLGFAVFGWTYLLLGLVPEARSQLATTRLLDYLLSQVFHKDAAVAVAFSPDGKWIASESTSAEVRLWDAKTGQTVVVKGVAPESFRKAGHTQFSLWNAKTGQTAVVKKADPECFRMVGHTLFSLLLASCGGVLSQHICSTRIRRDRSHFQSSGFREFRDEVEETVNPNR
jgi:hypothetical protein